MGLLPSWSTLSVIFLYFCTEIDNLLVEVNSGLNYEGTYSHTFLKLMICWSGLVLSFVQHYSSTIVVYFVCNIVCT